ncbi:MAG: hypothetical protein JNN06_15500 [Gemmobacter sp.]|uniref:DUF6477 family protein n=1 Tax=Gemmobacter sp. TaxID=1898957 RepID=UPI001A62BE02|nr:DUF6477 family protein [Gemmobacter sp.]MBL8563675.1 hypothetical protein [Gemmobacter sp.]
MTDFRRLLCDLRRPTLLLRAARFGLSDYQRDRDLKRLLREAAAGGPEKTVARLLHEENLLEETRRAGDASYSLTRHIELLIALLAEVNLLPKSQQNPA